MKGQNHPMTLISDNQRLIRHYPAYSMVTCQRRNYKDCLFILSCLSVLGLSSVCLLGPDHYGIFWADAHTDIREEDNSDILGEIPSIIF